MELTHQHGSGTALAAARGAIVATIAAMALGATPAATAASRLGADYFPNVLLTNQDGKSVRFYDDLIKGKTVAINIIYTSCTDECPLETAQLAQVQKLMGDRVGTKIHFYSISIDPKNDTPEVLKAYSAKFGAGLSWQFLTGSPEDIKRLTKKLGLSRTADAGLRDGHSAMLLVGDEPSGQWVRNSAVDNPRFLAASMANFLGWHDWKLDSTRPYDEAKQVNLTKGEQIFQSRCSTCHALGSGDKLGPDLAGVMRRRERDWITRYLSAPERVRAAGDPIALQLREKYKPVIMPNLSLGAEEVADLLGFFDKRIVAKQHDHSKHQH
ncbi:MAG: c-type cytochrome [Betaproteobacteria bacterium]|nr:c-type cytochrome [Betaproteobacteria bacterium]